MTSGLFTFWTVVLLFLLRSFDWNWPIPYPGSRIKCQNDIYIYFFVFTSIRKFYQAKWVFIDRTSWMWRPSWSGICTLWRVLKLLHQIISFYSKTFFVIGEVSWKVVTFPSLVGRRREKMISLIRTSGPVILPSTRFPVVIFTQLLNVACCLTCCLSVRLSECHLFRLSWKKPSRILPPNSLGVSCQRCHERTVISVGIATGYGLGCPEIESRWWATSSTPVQTGLGAHPTC